MKRAAWLMLVPVLLILTAGILNSFRPDGTAVVAAPPLSLEGFMDEVLPEAAKVKGEMKVDNFACYVCHGNYDGEELVAEHGKEEVGCVDCHGQSIEHRNDEDNITPPDKMYALDQVDDMCSECHDMHDAPARKVLERWQERCPKKTSPKEVVCTDCHFHHRLKFRTVWWDKKTGELIIRKEGERTKPAEDTTGPKQQSK